MPPLCRVAPAFVCRCGLLAGVLALAARPASAQNPLLVNQILESVRTAGQVTSHALPGQTLYPPSGGQEEGLTSCQRTPTASLPPDGGAYVAALESFLAGRHASWQADEGLLMLPAQEAAYAEALRLVRAHAPTWSTLAYEEEASFYRREDAARRQRMQEVQATWQRRARRLARRDSAARLARPAAGR